MLKLKPRRTNYRHLHNLEIIVVLKVLFINIHENVLEFVDMKGYLCSFKIPNVTFVLYKSLKLNNTHLLLYHKI